MKSALCALTLFVLPMPVLAQTAKIQKEVDRQLSQARTYEHIEIMRHLLQRKLGEFSTSCQRCHGGGEGRALVEALTFTPDGRYLAAGTDATVRIWDTTTGKLLKETKKPAGADIPVDGFYQRGQGVVLQIQAPGWMSFMGHETKSAADPKAPSEWDEVRRQLRGEKPESTPVRADQAHSFTLQDLLLQVVAENGRHFTDLAEGENLTLAVSFRHSTTQTGTWPPGSKPTAPPSPTGVGKPPQAGIYGPPGGGAGPGVGPGGGLGTGDPAKDMELLADLHAKQGRGKEALAAYHKALELTTQTSRQRDLYRKLAALYLQKAEGGTEQQQEAVLKALEYLRKTVEPTPTRAPTAIDPPPRLIIAAPRQALQAGTVEELRKRASVEWWRSTPAKADKGP